MSVSSSCSVSNSRLIGWRVSGGLLSVSARWGAFVALGTRRSVGAVIVTHVDLLGESVVARFDGGGIVRDSSGGNVAALEGVRVVSLSAWASQQLGAGSHHGRGKGELLAVQSQGISVKLEGNLNSLAGVENVVHLSVDVVDGVECVRGLCSEHSVV